MENCFRLIAHVFDLFADVFDMFSDISTNTVSFVSSVGAQPPDTGGRPLYPSPCSVQDYIWFHVPKIDAHRIAIMPPS